MLKKAVFVSFLSSLIALPALAVGPVIDHGTFVGTTVTFGDSGGLGVNEQTQSTGDPDTLYGAPSVIGDQLLFFPSTFSSVATGGASDTTSSILSMQIMGNGPLDVVSMISLSEFGDLVLSGTGTAATNVTATLSGTVTVIEDSTGPIAPIVIPFSGTISPMSSFDLVGNPGLTNWSGDVMIDVGSVVPDAKVVVLDLNNILTSDSETSSSATISKKVVSGPVVAIAVLPEPTCDLEIDKTCCIPEPPKPGHPKNICEGKAERIVFELTGGECGDTNNHQHGKAWCRGPNPILDPDNDQVTIKILRNADKILVNGVLAPWNSPLNLDLSVTNTLEFTSTTGHLLRNLKFMVWGPGGDQFLKINTSCHKPLRCDDQFGSVRLIELESTIGGIEDCNAPTGGETNCSDPAGGIGTPCDNKLVEATFRFNASDCQDPLANPQSGWASCYGDASDANQPVSIIYSGRRRSKVHITPNSGIVDGDTFRVSATGWRWLPGMLRLKVQDDDSIEQSIEIETACTVPAPISCGDVFGSLEVVGFKTKSGMEVSCETAPPPVFADACELPVAPPKPHCTGSLEKIQLAYLGDLFGADCSVSNDQGGQASCTGDDLSADDVSITVNTAGLEAEPDVDIDLRGPFMIFPSDPHDPLPSGIDVTATDGAGNTQTLWFRTDCEEPLNLGDRFGDFAVVGLDRGDGDSGWSHEDSDSDSDSDSDTGTPGEDGLISLGGLIEYQYKVTSPLTNTGAVDVTVVDDPNTNDGDPTTIEVGTATLNPGEMETFFVTRTLYETTTNKATVSGTDAAGMCTDAMDEVTVTSVLPPTGSFNCWKAKPIDELSMEWAGSQDVCVVAYDGAVGGTVLSTTDNIAPGDILTVSGMGGYPYTQEWEIFAAGDCGGTPLGESEFYIKCFDSNMNGVEDCGKNQGNGKWNDPALINDWLLEGMAGDEVLECTPVTIPSGGGGGMCGLGFELIFLTTPFIWLHARRRRRE